MVFMIVISRLLRTNNMQIFNVLIFGSSPNEKGLHAFRCTFVKGMDTKRVIFVELVGI